MLVPLYALTLFLTSTLLFILEPLVAKSLLPVLGGGAAVWTTAVAFFQVALLLGYLYAHLGPSWLGTRRHAWLHVSLFLAVAALMPLRAPIDWKAPSDHQALWLFGRLAVTIGPVFVLLAASAPLVQRWLASTTHAHARDPYFLYVASNIGSMAALLTYPVLIEPLFGLERQRTLWGILLVCAGVLLAACAAWTGRRADVITADASAAPPTSPPLTWRARLRWVGLAAVPASLLLSVTSYLTTDVMALPLLWVVPLALYLLTFIIAFSRRAPWTAKRLARVQPFLLLPVIVLLVLLANKTLWHVIPIHLLAFFVSSLVCHQALAESRPPGDRSTEFYLWLAAGGALGGLFNVFAAPLLFDTVVEYPIGVVAAALLRPRMTEPRPGEGEKARRQDLILPFGLLVVLLGGSWLANKGAGLTGTGSLVALSCLVAVGAVACYGFRDRPLRFGLGVAATMAGVAIFDPGGHVLHRARSFYAVHKVFEDPPGRRQLAHGNTLHGVQDVTPERRREPLAYFHRSGPIGGVMSAFAGTPQRRQVGVAGLGVGALAAYGAPGERWTFFEIDPVVVDIARDRGLFTFLTDSPAHVEVVLGDARLSLKSQADGSFGILILDAFSSDAVPAHLLTREAMQLYLRKLAPHGLLVFQISNRYLELEPVVAGGAAALGLTALSRFEQPTPAEIEKGKSASWWVVVARSSDDLAPLADDPRWQPARRASSASLGWTDDASDLWGAFRLRGPARR